MRGVRTTIYINEHMKIQTYHNRNIKAALNTVREHLYLGYDENLYLTYCDNKDQKEVKFQIKMYNKYQELVIGTLEILR